MRVSAAQFFAMSEADRAKVTHIDMDLDREAERRITTFPACPKPFEYEPTAEPGTDWTKPL